MLGSVEVEASPVGVVITPDSKKAYVAVYGENVVAVIDLQALKVAKRIPPVSPRMASLSHWADRNHSIRT